MQRSAIPCYARRGDARATCGGCSRTSSSRRTAAAAAFRSSRCSAIGGPFTLGGVEIVPVPLLHGALPVLGFRIGSFAYLTDCNRIPDESWPLLDGRAHARSSTRCAIVRTRRTSASREALDVVARLGAERAYFTHICHDLPHAATCARLPAGVELAYDGLVLDDRRSDDPV